MLHAFGPVNMKRLMAVFGALLPTLALAQDGAAAAPVEAAATNAAPDFLETIVDFVLGRLGVTSSGNTMTHYIIAAALVLGGLLLRKVLVSVVFGQLRRLASKSETRVDNRLLVALEAPAATFVMLLGIFAGLKVLKLYPAVENVVRIGGHVAFLVTVFWAMLRGLGALLDHVHDTAKARGSGVAPFMPWIRKTLVTVFFVFGVLVVAKSLGADVGAALAGLGIGGLAFALAAQDTIANIFGSIVVAVDQPFKQGEVIKISGNIGMVEDIGLRSTRLRLLDKSLMVIPNRTVAGEMITNFSRFTARRMEQVIGLTYDTPAEKMAEMVDEIRRILAAEPEVKPDSPLVFFRDFSASSLDIWMVYEVLKPDFQAAMRLRQRVNMAIMHAVESRGLSFAFPTQTVHFDGDIARQIARGPEPRN